MQYLYSELQLTINTINRCSTFINTISNVLRLYVEAVQFHRYNYRYHIATLQNGVATRRRYVATLQNGVATWRWYVATLQHGVATCQWYVATLQHSFDTLRRYNL